MDPLIFGRRKRESKSMSKTMMKRRETTKMKSTVRETNHANQKSSLSLKTTTSIPRLIQKSYVATRLPNSSIILPLWSLRHPNMPTLPTKKWTGWSWNTRVRASTCDRLIQINSRALSRTASFETKLQLSPVTMSLQNLS